MLWYYSKSLKINLRNLSMTDDHKNFNPRKFPAIRYAFLCTYVVKTLVLLMCRLNIAHMCTCIHMIVYVAKLRTYVLYHDQFDSLCQHITE